ncbi:hypothetical protein B0T20DRAFT_365682 [Sordaria brevicollis]|uniref:Uncharacterized protein n=1 Tax=Sordaria brevicollis TaxID=83679 RepID=A0AAE0NUT5_SORBR|nr:hypothetical protein B0T20DRAFT_365682 [Sordaria brevicollis]
MPLPPDTQRLMATHRFVVESKIAPREAHFTRADLISMGKQELIDQFLSLQERADQLTTCVDNMLRAKHTQAELLTSIELHLDIPPHLTESYHQSVALDHALTWMEVYNTDSDFLMQVSKIQTPVTTSRLKLIRDHLRNSGTVDSKSSSSTSPAASPLDMQHTTPTTLCKHVLSTEVKHFRPNSYTIGYNDPDRPLHQLTLHQIALGVSIREYINSFDDGNGPEQDDNEFWRRMDEPLLQAIDTPDMTAKDWNTMWFFAAWFRAVCSGHFETQRLAFLQELQRKARERAAYTRGAPMLCHDCRAEKVGEDDVAGSRFVEAEGKLLDWWRDNRKEVDAVTEGILQLVKLDERNRARRSSDLYARSMGLHEGISSSGFAASAYATGAAAATGLGIYQQEGPAAMLPDDLAVPGRYEPEF